MVDDLLHAEPGGRRSGVADLLDVAMLARPLRRGDGEAAFGEVVLVVLPTARRKPGAMNHYERDLPVLGAAGCHPVPPALLTLATLRPSAPAKKSDSGRIQTVWDSIIRHLRSCRPVGQPAFGIAEPQGCLHEISDLFGWRPPRNEVRRKVQRRVERHRDEAAA